jgi:hypothetical protein
MSCGVKIFCLANEMAADLPLLIEFLKVGPPLNSFQGGIDRAA